MAEFYRVLAGFHRFRSLYHCGRKAQEFNIAVSVGALLADVLNSADYSVKAPVERTRGADAHRKIAHGYCPGHSHEAYVEVAYPVTQSIHRIHAPAVFALFSHGAAPYSYLLIGEMPRLSAHHVRTVVKADILAEFEIRKLPEYIAENAVAFRKFEEAVPIDFVVLCVENCYYHKRRYLHRKQPRTGEQDYQRNSEQCRHIIHKPEHRTEHSDNSAAVPAHALLRLFESVKRFGIFRVLEIHLHGAVCKLNVNILAEPLLMNRFKLSCSTAENACQQLNYYVQSRENRRVRQVLCELRACYHKHQLVDYQLRHNCVLHF